MTLKVLRLHPEAQLPLRIYGESAAWDLHALCRTTSGHSFTTTIAPRSTRLIDTGLAMMAPKGSIILVCSRSGLAVRSIFVTNAPGVIDPDYTGEIKVLLYNGGFEPHYVKHGDRVAQALLVPLTICDVVEVEKLPETVRGEKGFGSSGT